MKKCDVALTHGDHVLLLGDTMVYPRENMLSPCFEISLLHRPWGDISDPVLCDEIGFKELPRECVNSSLKGGNKAVVHFFC